MKATMYTAGLGVLVAVAALLLVAVDAAPMELDDEQIENALVRPDNEVDLPTSWGPINTAALRQILIELENKERMSRNTRAFPQIEAGGWSRNVDGRLARPWRTDKRQVRFRQCYFNPISCFRK